jgi:hypothetical protein
MPCSLLLQDKGLSKLVREELLKLADKLRTDVASRARDACTPAARGAAKQRTTNLKQMASLLKCVVIYHLVMKAQVTTGERLGIQLRVPDQMRATI